jgi:hypothetical protein
MNFSMAAAFDWSRNSQGDFTGTNNTCSDVQLLKVGQKENLI